MLHPGFLNATRVSEFVSYNVFVLHECQWTYFSLLNHLVIGMDFTNPNTLSSKAMSFPKIYYLLGEGGNQNDIVVLFLVPMYCSPSLV